jgi:hypothetical protein
MIVLLLGRVTSSDVAQAILLLGHFLAAEPEGPEPPEPCVPRTSPAVFTESPTCAVCLEPHARGSVRVPCGHSFHAACIAEWARRARSCPVCRADIAQAS